MNLDARDAWLALGVAFLAAVLLFVPSKRSRSKSSRDDADSGSPFVDEAHSHSQDAHGHHSGFDSGHGDGGASGDGCGDGGGGH